MSYHNNRNDNDWILILLLCFLFPEAAAGLGLFYVLLWLLKAAFYAVVIAIYLVYTYPLQTLALIILVYISSKATPAETKKPINNNHLIK